MKPRLAALAAVLALTLTSALSADFPVRQASSPLLTPAVAYNSTDHQYLAVWTEVNFNGTNMPALMGQRLGEDGSLLGGPFQIFFIGSSPTVAYNSSANEYLVGFNPGSGYAGLRVSAAGNLLGDITSLMDGVSHGRLVYNSLTNQYLFLGAILKETPAGSGYYNIQLKSRKIGANGQALSSPVTVEDRPHGYQPGEPLFGIAFAPIQSSETPKGRHVVAIGHGVALKMLDSDGVPMSIIHDPDHPELTSQYIPFKTGNGWGGEYGVDVAYGTSSSYSMTGPAFLVVWADNNNSFGGHAWAGIHGGFVDPVKTDYRTNETIEDHSFPLSFEWDVHFEEPYALTWRPKVAFNYSSQKFYVAWRMTPGVDSRNDTKVNHIRGADVFDRVPSSPADNVIISATVAAADPQYPAVASSTTSEHALIVWQDFRDKGTTSANIYGSIQKVANPVPPPPPTTTWVVTNTNDAGSGSLRQAILNANARIGMDTIAFNIPGSGVHTIQPLSPLPATTDPVLIDGYTQPGSRANTALLENPDNAVLTIVIDGTAIGNAANAIGLLITGGNSRVRGLVMGSFAICAISVKDKGGNIIEGNFIGTNAAGTQPMTNSVEGLDLRSSGNVAGGTVPAARNIISGNHNSGILITGDGNTVQGNFIGLDASGTKTLRNEYGVQVSQGGGNLVGGLTQEAGNVISGNGATGVLLVNTGSAANSIKGNRIGTKADGVSGLGSSGNGILVLGGNAGSIIGGEEHGAGNVIACNGSEGILITSNSTKIRVSRNSFFSNGGLGINLDGGTEDGKNVTANDPGDADNGPNSLQNYPVLTTVEGGEFLSIEGTLNSTANTTFRLEFFSTPTQEIGGFRQGKTYLTFTNVVTNGSGNGGFNFTYGFPLGSGNVITATATDPNGNTSEFSAPVEVAVVTPPGVVTNTLDGGPHSLRQAILDANANPGIDTITFNIPGTGVHTISPVTPLPPLTQSVVIDGYTQPGSVKNTNAFSAGTNAVPTIEIEGSKIGSPTTGLIVQGGGTILRGLIINRFVQQCIMMQSRGGNRVEGCFLGTTADGLGTYSSMGAGIVVDSVSDNTIGGLQAQQRNVLCGGSSAPAVLIQKSAGKRNVLQGNYIGINARGNGTLVRLPYAVYILNAPSNTVGGTSPDAGNVIQVGSGTTGGSGIVIVGPQAIKNLVTGNLIGTDATGRLQLGVWEAGIVLTNGASGNTLGGTGTGARNVISVAQGTGVLLGTDSNTVQGNFIGTDITGTKSLPNQYGVRIYGKANRVGGRTQAAGNLISGNAKEGIVLAGSSPDPTSNRHNSVEGNRIGTRADGASPLGNGGAGVSVRSYTADNTIGDTAAGAGNTIAFNGSDGVRIATDPSSGSPDPMGARVSGNSIFGNSGIGINLVGGTEDAHGVTANHKGGPVTGPNGLQNYPVLTSAEGGNSIALQGTFNSKANTTYRLEVFATPKTQTITGCEGKTFLGKIPLTTDGSGNGTFTTTLNIAVGADQLITATATDPDGNTSEFSAPLPASYSNSDLIVTNADDDGPGSLRRAITAAGKMAGKDTIRFNIPGNPPFVIRPLSPLPSLGGSVVIDGFTQPGSKENTNGLKDPCNAILTIVLSGASLTSSQSPPDGLHMSGGTSCVRGLVIQSFSYGYGVVIEGGGNVLEGNFIGTSSTGLGISGNNFGVRVYSGSNNAIGGTAPASRNIISGNRYSDVSIESGASGNVVQGNYIGLDANGTAVLSSQQGDGISILDSPLNTIGGKSRGSGNVIGRASGGTKSCSGIYIHGAKAVQNLVAGNLIGTNASGTDSLRCYQTGIWIEANRNTIGGTEPEARNVISGNRLNGILITHADSNIVQGNYIGTDLTGTKALGNKWYGVEIEVGRGNHVGGRTASAGNLISANVEDGIVVHSYSSNAIAEDNTVEGNKIGTQVDGVSPLGNGGSGVIVRSWTAETMIGDTVAGAGNTIAFNDGDGVRVIKDAAADATDPLRARIVRNSIFGNRGIGINLAGGREDVAGVTANDAGDADTGPNGLQNHPVLTFGMGGNSLLLQGTLNSAPGTRYRLEFYSTPKNQTASGREGRTYLGSTSVTTDGSGNAGINTTIETAVPPGLQITATATDPTGNTSEFSAPFELTLVPGIEVVTNTLDGGAGSLRQAILNANAKPGRDTIAFGIPGTGVHVIHPVTGLPLITDPVVIDGYTQPGSRLNTNSVRTSCNAALMIVLNGSQMTTYSDGLSMTAGGSCVRGMDIQHFPVGIVLAKMGGNVVEGNSISNGFAGIKIDSSASNTIGGTRPEARNIIGANEYYAIGIQYPGSRWNRIQGNYVGVDASGTHALPNGIAGVFIYNASSNTIGGTTAEAGNVISGHSRSISPVTTSPSVAIKISESSSGNSVVANLIGTTATGSEPLPEGGGGILVEGSGNIIGDTSAAARNVISGNMLSGIEITGDSNYVLGNYIGTDVTGSKALGNNQGGVILRGARNHIGGLSPASGNLISANAPAGIVFDSAGTGKHTQGNVVQRNLIGTQHDGSSPLGNAGPGVLVRGWAIDDTIGGPAEGAGNIIAFNSGNGVRVIDDNGESAVPPSGIYVSGNSISANGQIGIDLAGGSEDSRGCTEDDPWDRDTGPNGLQNYPVITEAPAGEAIHIKGYLDAMADTGYTLDFYVTPLDDDACIGDGQMYLGSTAVRTNTGGRGEFNVPFAVPIGAGRAVTATATDHQGNTSEFSKPFVTGTDNVTNPGALLPREMALLQNYPNPFNPKTVIRFNVAGASDVKIVVYDILAREVATLVSERKGPGRYEVPLNASALASGVYIYRMTAGDFVAVKTMLLVK